ncbi:MAG: ATP-binding protein [Deltaproteobacteria bacterium]
MQDFEKLGVFYLGKGYDIAARRPRPELLLYDAKDLTTHAVCVGMTGSGKTGLCLTILEEAAIDGIPAIAVDPKGDLANLLLTFPELKPEDFRPWVDAAEAERCGISPDQLAEQTAAQWREGLAEWGQQPERIARFRDSAGAAIYTPGSTAGLPLTVLRSFAAPAPEILKDGDALRERTSAAVSGLLALLGIEADPLRSREHILLSNLVDRAWRERRDLDLAELIRDIQSPPFDKIGVMDLESIFPAKDRFGLSMSLNNLLASPGFAAWMEGDPLDIQRLLYTPAGKPRLSILSIAHLSEAERMFFVTILLNEVVAWMRSQPGTSSLRALLYMDEVFGYFPPSANPPAKTPMLTLLKQARAYGLGIVLATQNPVDLDYKGLSNAGTWFIGRLQTERDKSRVLDGLEGASTASGAAFDRQKIDQIVSGLGKRVFLMNNVHEDQPVVFQSRWALSYLRGPLSREQIQTLMERRKKNAKPQAVAAGVPARPAPSAATTEATAARTTAPTLTAAPPTLGQDAARRPVLPPEIPEFFLPQRKNLAAGATLCYHPALLGTARVHFAQSKSNVDVWEDVTLTAPLCDTLSASIWEEAQVSTEGAPELEKAPAAGAARFAPLPSELARPRKFAALTASLKDHLYRTQTFEIWKCPSLKQVSKPGESEGDFRVRLSQAAREFRDEKIAKLRAKYAPKVALVQERIRKARQKVEKERAQASQQTLQTALSFGSSLLGALFSRKIGSAANVSRATSAARAASRIGREKQDVTLAQENVQQYEDQLAELDAQFKAETAALDDSVNADKLELEDIVIKPRKADINVTLVALAWIPCALGADGSKTALI